MAGRFIAVVGPSGAGKDSLMAALCAARPDLCRVRRLITRAPGAGGEDFDPVSPALFAARAARGDFALRWHAHGLSYGIPASVSEDLERGQDVLANLSRGMLARADRIFANLLVLHVTARPGVLADRLAARGREDRAAIARRLARTGPALPAGLTLFEIDNSGPLADSVSSALSVLYPARL